MIGAGVGRDALRGIRGDGMREAVLQLMNQGWQAIRWTSQNHLLLSHPSGGRVTASCSASDRHAAKALVRSARNALTRQERRQS